MSCLHTKTKIIDSRKYGKGGYQKSFPYIKRRKRHCLNCKKKFVTFEVLAVQVRK